MAGRVMSATKKRMTKEEREDAKANARDKIVQAYHVCLLSPNELRRVARQCGADAKGQLLLRDMANANTAWERAKGRLERHLWGQERTRHLTHVWRKTRS